MTHTSHRLHYLGLYISQEYLVDVLSLQTGRKIRHSFGYFNLLRTYRFTASAANTGIRMLVFRHSHQSHGRNETAPGKAMFIVQLQQSRNIQLLWAMAYTIMTAGTGQGNLFYLSLIHI